MARERNFYLKTRKALTKDLEHVGSLMDTSAQLVEASLRVSQGCIIYYSDVYITQQESLYEESKCLALKLEKQIMSIMALQQPLLKDLRYVLGLLHISRSFHKGVSLALDIVRIIDGANHSNGFDLSILFGDLLQNFQISFTDIYSCLQNDSIEQCLKNNNVLKDSEIQLNDIFIGCFHYPQGAIESNLLVARLAQNLEKINIVLQEVNNEIYFIFSGENIK